LITSPIIDESGQLIGVIQAENMKAFLEKTMGKGEINKERETMTTYSRIIGACLTKA
jgi:hypothetical protein